MQQIDYIISRVQRWLLCFASLKRGISKKVYSKYGRDFSLNKMPGCALALKMRHEFKKKNYIRK